MTQPPEDDLTPGHDALTLAIGSYPDFVTITRYKAPDGWVARMYPIMNQYVKVNSGRANINPHVMFQMPDEWQQEMASLINEYALANPR